MTSLNKPVHRVTVEKYAVLYYGKARQIVCTLDKGDVLVFREHGCRARFSLPIEAAFKYAVRLSAMQAAAAKRVEKIKKKRGY